MSQQQGQGLPDVETLMKDLLSQPGVIGYMVFNDSGIPVKWSQTGFNLSTSGSGGSPIPTEVIHYAALISDLTMKSKKTCAKLFHEQYPESWDLQHFRLRTKKNEIIVAPGDGCTLVVLQKPHEEESEGAAKEGAAAAGGEAADVKAEKK